MWLWEEKDWVVSSISSAAVVLEMFFWPGWGDERWPLRSLLICCKQWVFSLGKWPYRELLGDSAVSRSYPRREMCDAPWSQESPFWWWNRGLHSSAFLTALQDQPQPPSPVRTCRHEGLKTYTLRVEQVWNLCLPQASGPDLYFQTLLKMLSGSAAFLHCGNFCRIKKCFKYGIWVFFLCSLEQSWASSSGPTLKGLAAPFPSLQLPFKKMFLIGG